MRQITAADGHALTVHELGGAGRAALLCHATGLHGAVWEPMAAVLAPDLERWAVDFHAHGASVVPPDLPLDWEGYTDDVLTVVDGLGLPTGTILGIGHSMGGAALLLAEERRPGTFAGLWLFEPIAPPPGAMASLPGGSNPLADGAERRRATFPSAAAALANYAAKPPLSRLRADALHAYVRHGFVPDASGDGTVHLACRPQDEASTFRQAPHHHAFEHLGEVGCPVVVACGDEGFGPGLFSPGIAEGLPHGQLQVFEQMGHFGPLEAPDRIAAAVNAFAATL